MYIFEYNNNIGQFGVYFCTVYLQCWNLNHYIVYWWVLSGRCSQVALFPLFWFCFKRFTPIKCLNLFANFQQFELVISTSFWNTVEIVTKFNIVFILWVHKEKKKCVKAVCDCSNVVICSFLYPDDLKELYNNSRKLPWFTSILHSWLVLQLASLSSVTILSCMVSVANYTLCPHRLWRPQYLSSVLCVMRKK